MITALRDRHAVLPAADTLDRIGRAARVLARRRMEAVLLDDLPAERLGDLDRLIEVDPAIWITRFAWLRSPPEAPGEKNLLALLERLRVIRDFGLDPRHRERTVYMERAVQNLRSTGIPAPDQLLAHVAPLGCEHINLTGDYLWEQAAETAVDYWPLRLQDPLLAAAG
jgi:hypothetical protein